MEQLRDKEHEDKPIGEGSQPDNKECMVLRTENLVKKYGKRTVVNNVSINVKQGEIVGLLGPNVQVRPLLFI